MHLRDLFAPQNILAKLTCFEQSSRFQRESLVRAQTGHCTIMHLCSTQKRVVQINSIYNIEGKIIKCLLAQTEAVFISFVNCPQAFTKT